MQRPLISCTQKIVIYETKARFYVVGSNNTETKFRVLKIDRMEPKELNVIDDKVEYSRKEIRDLLLMIDIGNRPRLLQKGPIGLKRTVSAFGIVGFVRFLEGYYMVLITKRRRIALIGTHTIFKIEDTCMVYIPNDMVRCAHSDEQRYVKMFQNIDLSSNFYFSYSYDVTHTLQFNMADCRLLSADVDSSAADPLSGAQFWQTDTNEDGFIHDSIGSESNVEDACSAVHSDLLAGDDPFSSAAGVGVENGMPSNAESGEIPTVENVDGTVVDCDSDKKTEKNDSVIYGVRTAPYWKYVWNEYLLRKVYSELQRDWVLFIVHGFIGQSMYVCQLLDETSNLLPDIDVFGRNIYLTLIARRSNQFAGTRFLKRGANCEGAVANEVETEQIVCDASATTLPKARFTSYVQHRGSIPLYWSQDVTKMVPKPPITVDQSDPYGQVAGQHFNQLLHRYGAPIIILDLVKKKEKKRHESIISQEFVDAMHYLNQFLPTQFVIKYIGFDMARVSKIKNSNVLLRLAKIADYCVRKTGIFQSHPVYYCRKIRPNPRCSGIIANQRQHGVVRTNCVDCLDRTNTAQFAIGKTALALQLHVLGIIDTPHLDFESDCVRMMEDLYEDQGDTLALQYGGSQLVHRIKGYRKVAPWTSSSRDIMQTLSRYYSNTFSDNDKQNAINLFLGMFEPREGQLNIWELVTDFYLHNSITLTGLKSRTRRYTQWWDHCAVKTLPLPCDEELKSVEDEQMLVKTHEHDERIDGFYEHYRPYELTVIEEQYCFNMPNSIRDFMPKYASNYSAFTMRGEPGRRQQEEFGSSVTEANPNVSGKDSTASTTSTGSEGSTSGSDGSELEGNLEDSDDESGLSKQTKETELVSLKDLFATMKQTYGVEIVEPDERNISLYKSYVAVGTNATSISEKQPTMKTFPHKPSAMLSFGSSYSVSPPRVSQQSRDIYEQYVARGRHGAGPPTTHDQLVYKQYAAIR